jgi:hypothetical protein
MNRCISLTTSTYKMKSLIRKYLHLHKSELFSGQILKIEDHFIQIDYTGTLLISYYEL